MGPSPAKESDSHLMQPLSDGQTQSRWRGYSSSASTAIVRSQGEFGTIACRWLILLASVLLARFLIKKPPWVVGPKGEEEGEEAV